VVLNNKTRSGKVAASTQAAPEQPTIPKKKRKVATRKLKESAYVTQEEEEVEDATGLVTREVKKKKVVDAATLAKIGELVKGIEVPASSLAREDAGVLAQQVVEATEDVQALATSEAGKMLMVVSDSEGVQGDKAAGSEVAAPEAVIDIPDSPHSHSVVEVESDSTQSSSSQSTSSSSATDYDDVPLGKLYPTTQKGQSSTTGTHKKPKTNISQEPVRSDIDDRIIGLSQRKAHFYDRFPVSTNPLRPPMIQPLNMVPSDENIEPSSSSHPTNYQTTLYS
jgi:hypothetical protein